MTTLPLRKLALAAMLTGALLATSACRQTTPDVIFPQVDYTSKAPLRLNVGSIEITDNNRAVDAPNRVERKFPNPPVEQLRKWATQRFQAAGGPNRLVVVIEDASATEEALKTKTGIEGAFTKQPNAKVEALAKVSVKLYTPQSNLPTVEANAQSRASRTIQEDASPYDRDKLMNDMTLKLVEDINVEVEKQVNAYFNNYKAY